MTTAAPVSTESSDETTLQSQRRAWAMLWTAFTLFVMSLALVIWAIPTILFRSTQLIPTTVSLSGGTVLVDRSGSSAPEALIEQINRVQPGTVIETRPASQTAIAYTTPNGTTLANVLLYSNTAAELHAMRTPRFSFSPRNHLVGLDIQRGRVRIDLDGDARRDTTFTVTTPHADVLLERAGSYSIEVDDVETQVIVRTGVATVQAGGESLPLGQQERTSIRAGAAPVGVLRGARNLIANGSFETTLSNGWTSYKNRSSPEAAEGVIERAFVSETRALRFARFDSNWAELGVTQSLNQDVRDFQSLELQLAVWISDQSLQNCGALGSECPIMVRIEYTDIGGNNHEWLQGFYYNPSSDPSLPTRCVTCPAPTASHQLIAQEVWFIFESPDLLALFADAGPEPVRIDAITIYASGHGFESYVTDVALLAQD